MKPEEALYHLVNYGPDYVPPFYRSMGRPQLEALVRECDKPTAEQRSEAALTRWAQQRMKMPAWVGMNEAKEKEKPETEAAAPLPREPETLIDRAIARDTRLSTPGRRRAAFLRHLQRCTSVAEAAARTGIDRRTAQRWYRKHPAFAKRWDDIVTQRRRLATENVVLGADGIERPVFYRGKKVGAPAQRHRALDLYLLKQADAAALRAEKRGEAQDDFEARVAAEVERRISEMPRSPRHQATTPDDEFTNVANDFDASGRDIAFAP